MEQPPPGLEQVGQATRQISIIAFDQIKGLKAPWTQAVYSTKVNDEMTGIIVALWATHPDGTTTQLMPAAEIVPFLNALYGLSGKLEKPFIGFSITMKPDGACETDFLYP